jgi:uncharacterized membrane protein
MRVNQEKSNVLRVLSLLIFSTGLVSMFGSVWLAFPCGFLFSIVFPGLSILIALRRSIRLNWESALFIIGLGISYLIFVSLIENWILRTTGVERPLSSHYLLPAIGIVNFSIIAAGYRRWLSSPIKVRQILLSRYDAITLTWAAVLLFGFTCGAIRLNNGASNWLSVVCYFGVAGLILWLLALYKKIHPSSILFALWLAALGIILSGWLRSNYVAGSDLDKEFQIFQLVKHSGYWSIGLYKDVYTACLSVSLLPVSLELVTKLPSLLVFKFLIPAIYSLIIPIVFLVARSVLKVRGAILATFFFFAQPPFTSWSWIPIRQEVAFLFFGLLILLFVRAKNDRGTKILFLIFGASMIVSHYSTSYVAVFLFLIYLLIQYLLKFFQKEKLHADSFLKYQHILILILFSFLWYSQLTVGFNNVTQFVAKSFGNIGSLFSSDVQQEGQTPLDHFNIFSSAGSTSVNPFQYANNQSQKALQRYGKSGLYPTTNNTFQTPPYTPQDSNVAQRLSLIRNILKVLGNLLVIFGIAGLLVTAWRKDKLSKLHILQLASIIFFAIALFLPFFSVSYGEDRLYQQLLIIIAGSVSVYSVLNFLKGRWRILAEASLTIFVIAYFLLLTQVLQVFTVSSQQSMATSNNSEQYYEYYVNDSDVKAAQWLAKNRNSEVPIVGDNFSQYRIATYSNLSILEQFQDGVFEGTIPRTSYVYESSTNTMTQTAFDNNGSIILYKFPTSFLDSQKDTLYTNKMDTIW